MQRILFDASVYIESLRSQDQALIQTRAVVPGTALWLSSVVIEGLYAGSNKNSIRIVEKLERDFKTVGRILTPEAGDWAGAGRILAKIGAKYGLKVLHTEKSTFLKPVSRKMFRPIVPKVPALGGTMTDLPDT